MRGRRGHAPCEADGSGLGGYGMEPATKITIRLGDGADGDDALPPAAAVVHDLRSPLAVVLGALDELRNAEMDAEEREALVELAVRSAHQALEMAEHVLQVARTSAGARTQVVCEDVDLVDLAQSVVDAMRHREDARRLRLVLAQEGGQVRIRGEHRALMRLVSNLVGNAIRHAQRLVHVMVVRDGERAKVIVEDDGEGIAPELHGQLFHPWQTGRGSCGTGLGLAIVQRIAETHGGTVHAENRLEGGARFVVRLPLFQLAGR